MSNRLREFHRSPDPDSAAGLLQRKDIQTKPVASGPRFPLDPYAGAEAVVDLAMLRLDSIKADAGVVHLGGQVTLQSLIESPVLAGQAGGLLPAAARYGGHLGLRNIATLGGLLLAGEGAPELRLALLALDAAVVVQGNGRTSVPLREYRPDDSDLILELSFKQLPAGGGGGLARVARTPLDQAIVAAAAVAGPGFARVAVAGAGPSPILKSVEGSAPRAADLAAAVQAEAAPAGDYLGSAEYRRAMAGVLARRALEAALRGA